MLERDPDEPGGDAEQLWENWQRPGVSQFRLMHVIPPTARPLPHAPVITCRGWTVDAPPYGGRVSAKCSKRGGRAW